MIVSECLWIVLAAALTGVVGDGGVTVVRLQLSHEEEHTLTLNSSIEYMLEFIPNSEQMQFPSKVYVKADGGDVAHPLLITSRQRNGAVSWQLPYLSQREVLYEMEATLCPDDPSYDVADSDCSQPEPYVRRNAFTLHVSSTCIAGVTLTVLATPARDFYLPFRSSTALLATLAAPKVFFYQFREGQDSVRLVMESEDELCALVSIQNHTCPILQREDQIQLTGLRFTMLQSGGVQLSRSRFPLGFYVVTIVKADDSECAGFETESWLQQALAWDDEGTPPTPPLRIKSGTVRMEPSLSRGQYAVATGVTVTVFVVFYALFFGVVLAQRWPGFAQYVSPKAPPADFNLTEAQAQAETDATQETPRRRQRRSSTATFDSDNNSDSDDENEDPQPLNVANTTSNVAIAPSNDTNAPTNAGNARSVRVTEPAEGSGNGVGLEADGARVAEATGATIVGRNGAILVEGNGVTAVEGNVVQFRVHEGAQPPLTPPPAYRDSTPFGLPHQLTLASLSRRRARVLRARSDRYLYTLYTVAVFYALPVVQFVSAFQIVFNVSGSLDICYYNFLCSHPAGALSDFNHVFSNLGYMLLGALFMLQLRRRRQRRKNTPRNEDYGIPAHYGLLSSLGAGMMVVGVLSASYHVCPNRLNFQFDTAFMYVLAVLSMVKIYQSRHPDVNARAHATFGILAVLIALVVWGVLGSGPFFWAIFTVLHLFTFLLLSLRIYYVGQFRLEKETLQRAARQLAAMPKLGVRPLYRARLVMLLIANGVNWTFAIWGLWTQTSDFAGHLLQLLLLNALIHMIFYLVMKLLHKERPRWYAWCFLAGAAAAWVPALYFFLSGSSNWSATPALSRHMNHECKVLQFYDSHDLWHMLSAVALYLSFNAMLTWDDGLAAVKRTDIAVF